MIKKHIYINYSKIFPSIICISFWLITTSCKKNYTCVCDVAETHNGTRENVTSSQTFSQKMKKKEATSSCHEIENTLIETTSQNYKSTYDTSVKCTIK